MEKFKNVLQVVNGLVVSKNVLGDKVEQKQSRAIKSDLVVGFTNALIEVGFEVMYDDKGLPVAVLDNGLIIGFDFIIRGLDTELSITPAPKVKKA